MNNLTSNDVIDNIQLNTVVPCLVVKVRSSEGPKTIPKQLGGTFKKFTFFVDNEAGGQNGRGRHIQCDVYGDAVEKFVPKVQTGAVICIKDAVTREQNEFTGGSTPFYLRLYGNAEIIAVNAPNHAYIPNEIMTEYRPSTSRPENTNSEQLSTPSNPNERKRGIEFIAEMEEGMCQFDSEKRRRFEIDCLYRLYTFK